MATSRARIAAQKKRPTRKATPIKVAKAVSVRRTKRKPIILQAKNAIDSFLDRYSGTDWMTFANRQRNTLIREIKNLSDEIIQKIADSPIFSQREDLIREARHHLEGVLHRVTTSSLLAKALDRARTPGGILSMLNIPSQQELKVLQHKLNRIEAQLGGSRPRKTGRSRSATFQ